MKKASERKPGFNAVDGTSTLDQARENKLGLTACLAATHDVCACCLLCLYHYIYTKPRLFAYHCFSKLNVISFIYLLSLSLSLTFTCLTLLYKEKKKLYYYVFGKYKNIIQNICMYVAK
jgi:hypothetical protein